VKLLGRKKAEDTTPCPRDADTAETGEASPATLSSGSGADRGSETTAPKGRPTPRRSEAGRRKGPVARAPMTAAEARARRKLLAGPKLSGAERKAARAARRAQRVDRREGMMSGEDRYLLPRDQGPVRRFVRDLVDARRNLLGVFMPSALGLTFFMLSVPPWLKFFTSPVMMVLIVIMLVDAIILCFKVRRRVKEKFPDSTENRWKLGIYAAGRAIQLRRTRVPRPQVERGSRVG
jgi:hypothetical protein